MPELLLELHSEEIPARMQAAAASDLERLVSAALREAGLPFDGAAAFAGPRRLTLTVQGLPGRTADRRETRKGPRTDAPAKAIEGFLASVGLESVDQCDVKEDKKGAFYVATREMPGRDAAAVLSETLPEAIARLTWPKSMRSAESSFRWVRPLGSVLCCFDGAPLPIVVGDLVAGDTTYGHRVLAPGPIHARRFDDYRDALAAAHVVLDGAERLETIRHEANTLAGAQGLSVVADEGLLAETAGLVEEPHPRLGAIDADFMSLPDEVILTVLRSHQKCFALRDPRTERLAPHFVFVANHPGSDRGEAIRRGNERVVRARLSDARFFWDQDRKTALADRVDGLERIVFQAQLGTVREKADRISQTARGVVAQAIWSATHLWRGAGELRVDRTIASLADFQDRIARAAVLSKADLTTEMVGEFPELQGLVGRWYAEADGEDAAVARAVAEHYRPLGPSDPIPKAPLSLALALADKIDTLVGFWAIDEKPTGSKDPFALRRAALGVIRCILDTRIRVSLRSVFLDCSVLGYQHQDKPVLTAKASNDLLAFFADRLKVALREKGVRHDLIDAVFALGGDDLVLIVKRVDALRDFLATEDGAALLAASKRAANILRIEEKKDDRRYDGAPDQNALQDEAERDLHHALDLAERDAVSALETEDFIAAMAAASRLRRPIDRFFEAVTVNADDPALRANRLRLLSRMRTVLNRMADFEKIEG